MYEYTRIIYGARELAQRREREAAAERIARHARAARRRRRSPNPGKALGRLRPSRQGSLEGEI